MPLFGFCFRCLMLYSPCLYKPGIVQLFVPRYQQHIHEYILYNTSWFKHKTPTFVSHECRMQHSNSNVTYCLLSCWPPWTVDEDDIANFFVKDLGPALAPKMCPEQSQAFKEVNNSQPFTVGFFDDPFLLDKPLPGISRHACTKFRANIRRTDCVAPIVCKILSPEIEYTLKPSNDAKPWFCTLPHKRPNVHAV